MAEDIAGLAYRSILVAFDGSPSAMQALRRALGVAKTCGSRVTVLTIDEATPRYAPGFGEVDQPDAVERQYHAELQEQARVVAAPLGISLQPVALEGNPGDEIVRHAAGNGIDLIAIGHASHQGLLGRFLGSTTRHVVDHAHCDVLVAR